MMEFDALNLPLRWNVLVAGLDDGVAGDLCWAVRLLREVAAVVADELEVGVATAGSFGRVGVESEPVTDLVGGPRPRRPHCID